MDEREQPAPDAGIRRLEALDKVTGRQQFCDDLKLPGMLYCRLLRSHLPHARIVAIDVSRARALPGVAEVLTGAEISTPYGLFPMSHDEQALCSEKVRFVGDPIAAVAADSEELAERALRAIEVELDPLEVIDTPERALDPTGEPLHAGRKRGNIDRVAALEFGDVEASLRAADYVQDDLFFYAGSTHMALEQHAALADAAPDGRLTVYASTQTPHYLHRTLAHVLDIDRSRIRVIATRPGGGFGGKTEPFNHELVVAALSLRCGRPVKICLSREEVFFCHRGRHPTLMRLRTGVDAGGRILGMHFSSLLDGGAYGSYGPASTYYTGVLQPATYAIPSYRFEGARVLTNKAPCGPKRGHGTPQGRFALEVQLDKIAVRLGIDPVDLRLQQLQPEDALTVNQLRIGSSGLARCIEEVVEASGWRERRAALPRGRGLGMACSSYICGAGLSIYPNEAPHSSAIVRLDRSGLVTLYCGTTDIGQGSDTVLAKLVADELGVALSQVRVVSGDTDLTPVDLGSYSSRVTLMAGNAALAAARRAREQLLGGLAVHFGVDRTALVCEGGSIGVRGAPEAVLSFADGVLKAEAQVGSISASGSYRPPAPAGRYRGAGVGPSPAYSYSAAVVEVAVDEQTGWIDVADVWLAHDVGRALNRQAVIGQIEGSVYMGLGEALMEEMAYTSAKLGLLHAGPSALDYKTPTGCDMCRVHAIVVEQPDAAGPRGAKEVGQGALLPVPPAVANAVFDSVGVRIDELPITPDKLSSALRRDRRAPHGRYGPRSFPDVPYPVPRRVPAPEGR